jgi:hypothetical protein
MPNNKDLEVWPVWEADLRPGAPRVSLGVPSALLPLIIYEASELRSATGFGHLEHRTDVENGSAHLLFLATLGKATDNPSEWFKALDFLMGATGVLATMAQNEALAATETSGSTDAFWRALIEIGPNLTDDFEAVNISRHFEQDRHGAHIRLERRDGAGIVRMKARSLGQLKSILRGLAIRTKDEM